MKNILGTKLADRYLIEEMVGVGGMCNVYRAFDAEALRTVAVKMLRDEYANDAEYLRRFRNESKAINTLNHPNIVKIYDVVLEAENPYLVMEYVSGITLKEYIERKKPIPGKTAANIVGLVLTALQKAHENGIIHRDVKPQNIMVTEKGEVKLMDFGIARFAMSQSHTIDGNAIGSVHYISPEQALGNAVDQRTDIYSVGVILFEMLCGRLPFDGESPISVALQQVEQNARPLRSINPNVPQGLEQITQHAMAKSPENRYAACSEMIADLRRWLADPKTTFHYAAASDQKKEGVSAKFDQLKGKVKQTAKSGKSGKSGKTGGINRFFNWGEATWFGRLFAVTCGVVLASLLFVFVMFQIYQPFKKVDDMAMPNLLGVDYRTAVSGAYKDLKIHLVSEENSAEYEAGQIMRQSPAPDKKVKVGSTVQVWVSTGAKMVPIPSFANQEATAVYAKLTNLGLTYSVSQIASDTIAEGHVVRTSPAAGESIPAGSTVVVYVSQGSDKERVAVPEVLGYPEEWAIQTIQDAQFEPVVTYQMTTFDKVGVVISQSPTAPSQVAIGSRITIVVGTEDASAVGGTTVTLQTIPPSLPGYVTVTAMMNGETVYGDSIIPENTRLISIPLKGTGSNVMVDILIDDIVYKSAMVDFETGQYVWTADYSASFTE